MELPPRPPLLTPSHPNLIRYGVTWDGSPNQPLLTPTDDGYWTPWHIAADLVDKLAHRSLESQDGGSLESLAPNDPSVE